MENISKFDPDNFGWLYTKLSKDEINHLWRCIKSGGEDNKSGLAGNISSSNLIKDEGNLFYDNILSKFIEKYDQEYPRYTSKAFRINPEVASEVCYTLSTMWVNRQKQYEFNPLHDHLGLFSFVVWMKIPTNWKDQKKIPISKESNSSSISNFSFSYTNILGESWEQHINMSSEMEGVIVFFPSSLRHQVYPFFNCEEERISISGNIVFNSKSSELISKIKTSKDLNIKKESTTTPEWGEWNQVSNSDEKETALSWESNQEKKDKWWDRSDTEYGIVYH